MSDTAVTVRPMQESDLNEWFRLRKELWDRATDDDHKAEMLDIIEDGDTQAVFVAEADEGRRIGFLEAGIRPFVEDCETEDVGYLEGWYVDKAFRRQGIGTALVRAAEQWAFSRGCQEMASDAEIGNDLSLIAHERLGYEETSRLVHLKKTLVRSE